MSTSFLCRVGSSAVLLPLTVLAIYEGGLLFKIFVALAFGIAVKEWVRMARQSNKMLRDIFIGLVYLFIGFFSFILLRTEFEAGLFYTLVLLFGVWASDSGAYFAGKHFGGAKLMPKISPNKTWAGLIGGTLASAFTVMALNYLLPKYGGFIGINVEPFTSLPIALGIGVLVTVFGQIGDLVMSAYKRRVDVKDTGTLIPGHGGLLDRIDSLLLVTPLFLLLTLEVL